MAVSVCPAPFNQKAINLKLGKLILQELIFPLSAKRGSGF